MHFGIINTILVAIANLLGIFQPSGDVIKDVPGEECLRPCVENGAPLRCHYNFIIESYYVLSLACFACPYNITDCYRKDCVATVGTLRAIVTANRMMPGPSIQVCKGDTIIVNVSNQAEPQATAIHWHGIKQFGTQYMDGVPMVTQCPIQPFDWFRYKFSVPDSGTYFWHSHIAAQKADGLMGSLVVRQPGDQKRYNYDYDLAEHVIMINDWFNVSIIDLYAKSMFYKVDFQPYAILVNGRGRYEKFVANGAVYQTPLAVFTVQRGKRYRFRVIGGNFECGIQVSISSHKLEIIATDANPVVPVIVDGVNILAGERYDFVLDANKPVGNYWMNFRGLDTCDNRTVSAYQTAILRYVGAPIQDPPEILSYGYTVANGYVLNPVVPDSPTMQGAVTTLRSTAPNDITVFQRIPDIQYIVEYDFRVINDSIYNRPMYFQGNKTFPYHLPPTLPMFNYILNSFPPSPLLSQYDSVPKDMLCDEETFRREGRNCTKDFCMCTQLLKVPLGVVAQLVLIDDGIFPVHVDHPIHLHGYSFRVVAMGRFSENNLTAEEVKKLARENKLVQRLNHAVLKDTINVPNGGYSVIRFHSTNPGFWLLHCHIDVHLKIGMALTIQVGEIDDYPKPPKGFPKCGNF